MGFVNGPKLLILVPSHLAIGCHEGLDVVVIMVVIIAAPNIISGATESRR